METLDSSAAAAHNVSASRPHGMTNAAGDLNLLPPMLPLAERAGSRTRRAGICFAAAAVDASPWLKPRRSVVTAGSWPFGAFGSWG